MQNNSFSTSKLLILNLGYKDELHKVNLINQDGQYRVDYEPCNFLRGVIETGIIDNIVPICNAFNTFATGENHPFTKFIESTNLYGEKLLNLDSKDIVENYENWFELNKNTFLDWC